ncbi:unnamed protein product, partial [Prorocentrum cordatum]
IYRVVIEGRPDFEGVDVAVRRVLPGCGAADATFSSDGGEAHPLTPHSVEAFLATGRALASGQVVLRLDVPEVCEESYPRRRGPLCCNRLLPRHQRSLPSPVAAAAPGPAPPRRARGGAAGRPRYPP